jgi:speckle-type POZ protein
MQSKPSSSPAGSAPPPTTTSSTSAVETVEGTHVFHVCGYTLLKGIGAGKFVRSGTFAVGGYHWSLRFFPGGESGSDGRGTTTSTSPDQYCCFRVDLMSKEAGAKAFFTIGLVNQADGSTRWEPTTPLMNLSTAAASQRSASARIAVRRSKLEDFAVLRGDRVSVVCVVGVVLIQPVSPAEPVSRLVQVLLLLGTRKSGQDLRTQENDVCKRLSQSCR